LQLDEQNSHTSKCIRCDTCDGYPCLVDAKSDAQVLCVDPALRFPNVSLLTNAYVERLETNAAGREISRVVVSRNGARESYSADLVVVSCGAINSAALLLRSANDKHPRGLANGSDVIGRHYMGHTNSVMLALSKCPNPTLYQKSLAVNDFYFGSKEWNHPMGHISFVAKLDGTALSAGAPGIAPGWTLDLMAKHTLSFWITRKICQTQTIASPLTATGKSFCSTRRTTKNRTAACLPSSKNSCSSKPNVAFMATNVMKDCSRVIYSSVTVFHSQAWHTRTVRFGSVLTPRPPHWTRIARRTKSTIFMLWIAASSLPAPLLTPR